jgi:hypothetical protein
MKTLVLAAGVIGVALGGLWLLQGLGVVHIPPILCVADCAPLQGASPAWAIIGFLTVAAGALAIFYAVKR